MLILGLSEANADIRIRRSQCTSWAEGPLSGAAASQTLTPPQRGGGGLGYGGNAPIKLWSHAEGSLSEVSGHGSSIIYGRVVFVGTLFSVWDDHQGCIISRIY